MLDVVIRAIAPADWQAYRDLRLEALQRAPTAFAMDYETEVARDDAYWRQRIEQTLNSDFRAMFVAEHHQHLVGMTGIFRDELPKLRHAANIGAVYVRPDARGQGVADQLIAACLDWARSQHLRFVRLGVNVSNTPALRCYLRCGFRVYGTDPEAIFHDGVYYDELLMLRSLD